MRNCFHPQEGSTHESSPLRLSSAVTTLTAALFILYELMKEFLYPQITSWQSHIMTISLATALAAATSYYAFGRIKRGEELYRSLFGRMLDGYYLSTHEGRFVDVNPAFVKMFGYSSREEMLNIPNIGQALYLSPDERGKHIPETAEKGVEVFPMLRKDGSMIWVEDHGGYIHDKNGKVVYHEGILRDVTERKRMEVELRKSTQFLETVIQSAEVWLDVIDLECNVLVWNKAAESISGFSSAEVVGHRKVWEWLYPDERYRKEIMDTIPNPQLDLETHIKRKDGENRIISWDERRLSDGNGKNVGSIVIGRDVTDEKRMKNEIKRYSEHLEEMVKERTGQLAESEVRFRELANLLPQTVYELDQRGNFTFVNRSGIMSLRYTEEEMHSGLNAIQVFVEQDRDRVKEHTGRILAGENLGPSEYTGLRKDGTTFPMIAQSTPILHEGKPVGLRGIAVDITERKRMEDELQAAKERLEYVISSNPAAVFTGKLLPDCSEWDLSYISDRATELVGFEPRHFIGHPDLWESHVHPDDLRSTLATVAHIKEGHYACDYRFRHKDGRYRWIREEARLIRDASHNPLEVVGYWTDVTELKDLEQRLQQAEHLAAIGETAAMVGHDLRNPLQGIAAAVYLLRDESLTADERNEMLRLIENNVEYSDGIVKDLLDYSRPVDLTLTEITPRQIIADTLKAVRVPGRIKVQNQSQERPVFLVDTDRMKRAFVNVIENAVDAMPDGGTLTISTKESNDFLDLVFTDTGPGLPKEILDNLWKPLRTTKAKGMGLGLPIVKRIVDAHKGEISAESKAGVGTTYTIRLPFKRNEASQ